MHMTVRDVAKCLNVTEKTVYRWIREGEIPSSKVNEQHRFNRSELLEWATTRNIPMAPGFPQGGQSDGETCGLAAALERGGIHHGVRAADKAAALREVVGLMRFPADTDREAFLRVLEAREELGSTGFGDGIAIPHVRTPLVLHVSEPMITLCFLETPVDFHAVDGKPVHALFTMVTPTVRAHLHLISRLAYALRDRQFGRAVALRGTTEEILREARRIEAGFGQ